jgi:hypothetical protein
MKLSTGSPDPLPPFFVNTDSKELTGKHNSRSDFRSFGAARHCEGGYSGLESGRKAETPGSALHCISPARRRILGRV